MSHERSLTTNGDSYGLIRMHVGYPARTKQFLSWFPPIEGTTYRKMSFRIAILNRMKP